MNTYIITGASDGLAAEFGKLAISHGHTIICLSRSKPNYDAIHIETDLSKPTSIDAAVTKIKSEYPEFSALINCAGMITIEAQGELTYENLEKTLAVNVLAPAYLTSGLFSLIKQNGSDVVNVGSTVGTKAYPEQCAYGASKWGIRGVTKNLELELKGTASRVIQFNPGGFKSTFVQKFTKEEGVDFSAYMEAKDVASILYFILQLPKKVEVSEILINRK